VLGLLCSLLGVQGICGFVGAPGGSQAAGRVRRRAGQGFSGPASEPKKDSQSKKSAGSSSDKSEDKSESKGEGKKRSSALSRLIEDRKSRELAQTKLQDLRENMLAKRVKREAELDEYEEGRALIAKYGPKVGMMPEKVVQRTAKRGVVIGGAFYGTMLAVFVGGIALYKTQDIIIPPTLVAFITLALLALTIIGSSYGMMSSQWDPEKEQSLLGTEEFSDNMQRLGEGFRRASLQPEYDKGLEQRREKRKLLDYKAKKRELLAEKAGTK
jgi:hypothetical protein